MKKKSKFNDNNCLLRREAVILLPEGSKNTVLDAAFSDMENNKESINKALRAICQKIERLSGRQMPDISVVFKIEYQGKGSRSTVTKETRLYCDINSAKSGAGAGYGSKQSHIVEITQDTSVDGCSVITKGNYNCSEVRLGKCTTGQAVKIITSIATDILIDIAYFNSFSPLKEKRYACESTQAFNEYKQCYLGAKFKTTTITIPYGNISLSERQYVSFLSIYRDPITLSLSDEALDDYIDMWSEFIADLIAKGRLAPFDVCTGILEIIDFARNFSRKSRNLNFTELQNKLDGLQKSGKYGMYLLAIAKSRPKTRKARNSWVTLCRKSRYTQNMICILPLYDEDKRYLHSTLSVSYDFITFYLGENQ